MLNWKNPSKRRGTVKEYNCSICHQKRKHVSDFLEVKVEPNSAFFSGFQKSIELNHL